MRVSWTTNIIMNIKFRSELQAYSESRYFPDCLLEWRHVKTYLAEEAGTCICGHVMMEQYMIQHLLNGKNLIVRNHCVKQFPGISTTESVCRVRREIRTPLNPACLHEALNKRIIHDREYAFYMDTWWRNKLTPKQIIWRIAINNKILKALDNNPGNLPSSPFYGRKIRKAPFMVTLLLV